MDPFLRQVAREIEQYCGIHIGKETQYNFKKAVDSCIREKQSPIPLFNKSDLQCIIERLIINETFFFREPKYLPVVESFVKESRGVAAVLSMGSSTGEEPYSVAMWCMEAGLGSKITLWGCDISGSALAVARKGIYLKHALRQTNPLYLKYFRQEQGKYVIDDTVASRVTFRECNLLRLGNEEYGGRRFNIIIARNIFIYFKKMMDPIRENIKALGLPGAVLITTPVEYEKVKSLEGYGIRVMAI